MTAAAVEFQKIHANMGIAAEWERIELLARCLLDSRRERPPNEESLQRLQHLQEHVGLLRKMDDSPWDVLPLIDLPPLALDVLAVVVAAEVRSTIGWLYQELQPGATQAKPTPALIQTLLALSDDETGALLALIHADGEMVRRQLVWNSEEGSVTTLRPGPNVTALLMGWPRREEAPPGACRVRRLARREELVLPPDRELLIDEFLYWLRHRDTVVGRWGGHFAGGPVALFSGPSGTGKTFAAGVIASELGWPLYRVDLSRLVSKYIGETEKNIGRMLDAAHGRPMVLLFDEADALMSKRGEIKEARDRYANMEVSYLLARIEEHQGPCILTTNLRSQIDKAFARRFQLVVEFPRPDAAARKRLWQRMLPPQAPLHPDLNFDFLASAVNLSGGNIRNAGLHAAYLAAADQRPIDLGHIATGVWRELAKERPQVSLPDLGPLSEHLPVKITTEGDQS